MDVEGSRMPGRTVQFYALRLSVLRPSMNHAEFSRVSDDL